MEESVHNLKDDGYVYLCRMLDYWKIGSSAYPAERMTSLDVGPVPITLVHAFASRMAARVERTLHCAFRKKRVRKEWFSLSAEDVSAICSIQVCPTVSDLPDRLRQTPDASKARRKPRRDRQRKRRAAIVSIHPKLLQQVDLLADRNAMRRSHVLSIGLREYLEREGFWPPPPQA